MSHEPPERRHGYLTSSRHELDPRPLVLHGGPLDGRTCELVAAVGQRVFCGDGTWAAGEVYLVTPRTVADDDGLERHVCIPAFADGT